MCGQGGEDRVFLLSKEELHQLTQRISIGDPSYSTIYILHLFCARHVFHDSGNTGSAFTLPLLDTRWTPYHAIITRRRRRAGWGCPIAVRRRGAGDLLPAGRVSGSKGGTATGSVLQPFSGKMCGKPIPI